jgi:hypothetical protein
VDARGFAPDAVNVTDQRREDGSLLTWFERLIRRRKECPELGWGAFRLLETPQAAVFAHRCDWDGSAVLALHNLSGRPVSTHVTVDDHGALAGIVDLFRTEEHELGAGGRLDIELEPYGFRWLRLVRPGRPPAL